MNSVMSAQHDFSKVPSAEIQRSSFDRSHGYKTTFDAGYLVPFFVDEALPGDTFNLRATAFARLATPIKPVMDNMFMETFFFAVPLRLIWTNFPKFMGEQTNPGDSTSYLVPTITAPNFGAGGIAIGSLSDYMGLPAGPLAAANTGIVFNSLHHRAYNLIWNQWFRDQNLQNSVVVDVDDGPDTYTDYVLLRRGKRHDYFTSCLPWTQKGTAVTIPLGTSAPILGIGLQESVLGSVPAVSPTLRMAGGTTGTFTGWRVDPAAAGGADDLARMWVQNNPAGYPGWYADLNAAASASINSLRQAFQLQKFYERDARGGTRYTEIVRAHFNVVSPDARMQRAEYLGGGSSMVNIHPVEQTSVSAATPQGNLAAFGTGSFSGHGFSKSFTEHCVIIGMVSVRADLTYQQGLNRMWSRQTRADFYWPAFAHLGEQSVLNKEIYAQGGGVAADALVFGYQERYAEYRYKPSQITGLFRSVAAGSLDVWHLSEEYVSLPTLGSTFIASDPPIDRVIVTATEPHFLFDSYINLKCARPMPIYGVPGLIDHF